VRLRTFRAHTLAEAMSQIRGELGPDALILSDTTRDGLVEVTAAIETALPAPAVDAGRRGAPAAGPAGPRRPSPFDDLEPLSIPPHAGEASVKRQPPRVPREALLAWHGLDPELAASLAHGSLEAACERCFRFQPLALEPGEKPLLLVGTPGSGKTLTCARLATRLVLAGREPLVITADGQRAGAIDQLAAFTRLLGLTMIVADTPAMLARALARRADGQPVLIDAPGLDAQDRQEARSIEELLDAAQARPVLVMSGGLDPDEAQDLAAAYAALGARALIATRLDKTRRLGGILQPALSARLALAEAGIGNGVADGLVPFSPRLLADHLQRHAASAASPRQPPASVAGRTADPAPTIVRHAALPLHIAAQRRGVSTS